MACGRTTVLAVGAATLTLLLAGIWLGSPWWHAYWVNQSASWSVGLIWGSAAASWGPAGSQVPVRPEFGALKLKPLLRLAPRVSQHNGGYAVRLPLWIPLLASAGATVALIRRARRREFGL